MRKILAFFLAFAMVAISAFAMADQSVTLENVDSITMNKANGTYALQMKGEDVYKLVDAQGNLIADAHYLYMYPKEEYYKVRVTDSGNGNGLIDAQGKTVVPMEYADVSIISDRWMVGFKGIVVENGAEYDINDYSVHYLFDTADVYFNGTKVGTLNREEYADGYSFTAYGDYLQIKDRNGAYHHYDKNMTESGNTESGEYVYDGWTHVYTHTGTNQQVFAPGCTLTADEVKVPCKEDHGSVVDLQGNQLFESTYSYVGSYSPVNGGVLLVNGDQGWGLVDLAGNVLLPAEYDRIDYSFENTLEYGFVPVVKDGLAGFVSLNGADTSATFLYPDDEVMKCGLYYRTQGEDNKYTVISAVAGKLDMQFDLVSFPTSSLGVKSPTFIGKTADGKVAVYGLNGEELLTNTRWRDSYNVTLSVDGKAVCGQENYDVYTLYVLDYQPEALISAAAPEQTEAPVEEAGNSTVIGQVRDAKNRDEAVVGATVSVYDEEELVASTVTDENGQYSISGLKAQLYKIIVSMENHIDFTEFLTLDEDEVNYAETTTLVEGREDQTGTVTGQVINALTGRGVEGADLIARADWNTTEGEPVAEGHADANGAYRLDLPVGYYTITAENEGFTTGTFNVVVLPDQVADSQNGTITPILADDEYRIILTWDANPADLDSHLFGHRPDGSEFHVYFSIKQALDGDSEICNLDVDDVNSYGPETITLRPNADTPYYYYIHKYNGTGSICSTSQASIAVYNGANLVATYNAPVDQGDGIYWNVFALANGQIITRNTITDQPDTQYAN